MTAALLIALLVFEALHHARVAWDAFHPLMWQGWVLLLGGPLLFAELLVYLVGIPWAVFLVKMGGRLRAAGARNVPGAGTIVASYLVPIASLVWHPWVLVRLWTEACLAASRGRERGETGSLLIVAYYIAGIVNGILYTRTSPLFVDEFSRVQGRGSVAMIRGFAALVALACAALVWAFERKLGEVQAALRPASGVPAAGHAAAAAGPTMQRAD